MGNICQDNPLENIEITDHQLSFMIDKIIMDEKKDKKNIYKLKQKKDNISIK